MSLVYMSQLPALCRKVIMLMYSRSDVAPERRERARMARWIAKFILKHD